MTKWANLEHSSESEEQQALFEWARMNENAIPELRLIFAIPNGGKRPFTTAARLKKEGVKPGIPDICLPVSRACFYGLYIEMKVGKNMLTKEQKWWRNELTAQQYYVAVCCGWEEAKNMILRYLQSKYEPGKKDKKKFEGQEDQG